MTAIEEEVRALLEGHWDERRGWSVPNPRTYPHLWLWDSCFHAIVWAELGDERAVRELSAVLAGMTGDGMVPHMRYGGQDPDTWLGPLPTSSSLTQPPIFGHAIAVLGERGLRVPDVDVERALRAYDWLWEHRRTPDGLLVIVHPWEAGNDHSPRWDDWGAPGRTPADWSRAARTAWNKDLMHATRIAPDGSGVWSERFVVAAASFNAYAAFSMRRLATAIGDAELGRRAEQLADAIDARLWNSEEGLWSDLAVVGGGPSVHAPISDGIMPALVTRDVERARRALAQMEDPERFRAPYGPANVARTSAAYDPGSYWRGPAWPQLSYLLWLALNRHGETARATELARTTRAAAVGSGWAEYWNPETGAGLGAAPQSWTGIVLAMTPE